MAVSDLAENTSWGWDGVFKCMRARASIIGFLKVAFYKWYPQSISLLINITIEIFILYM